MTLEFNGSEGVPYDAKAREWLDQAPARRH